MIPGVALTIGNFLGGLFGKKIGEKISEKTIDLIERKSKSKLTEQERAEVQKEMLETAIKMEEIDLKNIEARGKFIKACINAMPIIAWVLPIGLALLILCFNVQFWIDVICSLKGREAPIIHIDEHYYELCKIFVMFLFGSKSIGKLSPWHDSSSKDYGNKVLNMIYK